VSRRDKAPVAADALQSALVVGAFGRHCLIETDDGQRLIAHPRGKKNQAVVGDRVQWAATGDEASIERLQARRNLFYRQDEIRTKSFPANLDRVLILIAAEPEFSESQLSRALVAAEAEKNHADHCAQQKRPERALCPCLGSSGPLPRDGLHRAVAGAGPSQ